MQFKNLGAKNGQIIGLLFQLNNSSRARGIRVESNVVIYQKNVKNFS